MSQVRTESELHFICTLHLSSYCLTAFRHGNLPESQTFGSASVKGCTLYMHRQNLVGSKLFLKVRLAQIL